MYKFVDKEVDIEIARIKHPETDELIEPLLTPVGEVGWELELETRKWGIKYFVPHVPDQTIEVYFDLEDDTPGLQTTLDIKGVNVEILSINNNSFYLLCLEYDYKKDKWIAYFGD